MLVLEAAKSSVAAAAWAVDFIDRFGLRNYTDFGFFSYRKYFRTNYLAVLVGLCMGVPETPFRRVIGWEMRGHEVFNRVAATLHRRKR